MTHDFLNFVCFKVTGFFMSDYWLFFTLPNTSLLMN